MPQLHAKWHKIQSLRQVWNGNVPIAPILMRRICQGLFMEIPVRLDEPVSCAVTCFFHQVMEAHLRRNNYYREARLVIPVWQEFIFGLKNIKTQVSCGFFSVFFSADFFHRNVVLKGSYEFLFSATFTGIFRRNSCGTGIPVFPPASSGFLQDSCSRQNCLSLASRQILPRLALPEASPPRILTDKRSQALRALHQTCFIQCNNMSYYN